MTSDLDLSCALVMDVPETDADFRFRVLREACARQQRRVARRKAAYVLAIFTLAGLGFGVLEQLGLGASVSTPLMGAVCLSAVAFEFVAWANERRSVLLAGMRIILG